MTVVRASVLGYCMGVKRAVESACQSLQKISSGGTVYTLGPLIHNPSVLNELSLKGLKVLDVSDIPRLTASDIVLIRAHGTTVQVEKALRSSGAQIVDATCPRVHGSQNLVKKWSEKGAQIIIAGDKNHGEVIGVSSYAKAPPVVVQDKNEAESITVQDNAVLVSQTTFSPEEFKKISDVLTKKNPSLTVINSICTATLERQKALCLLKDVDGILVIGGKNSANTRRLYQTALTLCQSSALIEDASEIPSEFFLMNRVGLTAGASTPDSAIDAIEHALTKGR